MPYDFSTIQDPLVQQYLKDKYGDGNKVKNAQQGVDNADAMSAVAGFGDMIANAGNRPQVLENRMQDLGSAPTIIQPDKIKTDVSGLQKQAQLKLDQATSDEDNAVKVAFEQRKAELAKEAADAAAGRAQMNWGLDYNAKLDRAAKDDAHRQKVLDQQMEIARINAGVKKEKVAADNAKESAPKPLTSEAALKLANFKNALQAIDEMEKALDADQDTFTLFGDNDFTLAQDKFAEGYGRGSSGASITKDERDAFRSRTPGWKNNTDEKKAKIRELREDINMKIQALDPNAAAPSSKVTVSNGTETLEIDASDLAHAEQDGYKRIK